MSKPNEDRDVYYIPPNFLTSGRLFGGMIRARNAIEACVLVLLTGVPIIKLPFSLTTRIIILCLVSLPLGIFGVIGFEVIRFLSSLLTGCVGSSIAGHYTDQTLRFRGT